MNDNWYLNKVRHSTWLPPQRPGALLGCRTTKHGGIISESHGGVESRHAQKSSQKR